MPDLEAPVPYDPVRFDLDPEVLLNAMRFRRSIRRFTGEKAARLMELARKAQVPREQFAELTDGQHCHCGFDLGKRIDLSGTGAVFPLPDGRYGIKAHGFLPENAATRHEHTDGPYIAWPGAG